MSSSIDFRVFP